jgi:hypothetical protein
MRERRGQAIRVENNTGKHTEGNGLHQTWKEADSGNAGKVMVGKSSGNLVRPIYASR